MEHKQSGANRNLNHREGGVAPTRVNTVSRRARQRFGEAAQAIRSRANEGAYGALSMRRRVKPKGEAGERDSKVSFMKNP